jgi:phosphate starvation-inducible PhoH-like protein
MSKKGGKQRLPENKHSLVAGFTARTDKQAELINLIEEREVVIATGPAGTGKTFVSLATALSLLDQGFKKIILIKSVTTIPGENIGFLPGSAGEKMEPFLMSFT